MRPWRLRRAVELLPEPAPERKTIPVHRGHGTHPDSATLCYCGYPLETCAGYGRAVEEAQVTAPPDRGAAFTYQSLAESRLEQIRDLQAALDAAHAENTRLRADLGLAGHRLPCGGCQRLAEANTRLDDQLETCRREHLDKDAADALRAQLAMRVGAVQPW